MSALAWLAALAFAAADLRAQETDAIAEDPAAAYVASLRRARDTLMAADDFEAALDPAQIVVREAQSAENESAAADRIMLAIILAELERHDEAEIELLDVVEALQDDEGLFSETLIMPLRLLGRTYIRARLFPEAITALSQARDVSRRSAGLFNVEHQIGVIDDLTTAQLGLGDTVAARDLQIERLEMAQRQFGSDDPQVIPYHYYFADYLERSRLRQSAREQYETALEIARMNDDTRQTLIALSNVVRQDLQGISGTRELKELQALVDSMSDDEYAHELGIAYAVLADAALMDEDEELAGASYLRAWELIAAGGQADPAEYFADPAAIRFNLPLTAVDIGARSLPYAFGEIALHFDVSRNGRVEQIHDVAAQPAELMEEAYVERLNAAWFRPALAAGEPIDATDVVFRHYFRYYVDPSESDD